MSARVIRHWNVGEYEFTEVLWHDGTTVYGTALDGKQSHEYHATLDKALLAAVGEKHTGARGAGGTGVGTAADWFAAAIGLEANK